MRNGGWLVLCEDIQINNKSCTTNSIVSVFGPDTSRVQRNMFGSKGKTESGAFRPGTLPRRPTSRKALEDLFFFAIYQTASIVFDNYPYARFGRIVVGELNNDLWFTATMDACIINQVGKHAGKSTFVTLHKDLIGPCGEDDICAGE
jgi:hypothetical protein